MASYHKINQCRISDSSNFVSVLNLGHQALTGVFPSNVSASVTQGPLELVWCQDSGLLQLNHSYNPTEMYGDNYGYRSGLNQSMVNHLTNKVAYLEQLVALQDNDVIVDIGSNDATTLKAYTHKKIKRVGIDPTGNKFLRYYSNGIKLVPDFFSKEAYFSCETKRARIVTSIAMFYDLEAPISFAKQVEAILADDGIWHFEQSYMPSMLRLNSYDTICHEHLEYYSSKVIIELAKKNFEESNCKLITLSDYNSMLKVAVKSDYVSESDVESLTEWRLAPNKWNPTTKV
ncbi:MAG: hypothetical protein COB66_09190 [Coxiella sp. (in: Bacteria)]|nr:MAG: hypothetical protein COB66_09190 [Coxiella sp. (in: g-proteobacteria)]